MVLFLLCTFLCDSLVAWIQHWWLGFPPEGGRATFVPPALVLGWWGFIVWTHFWVGLCESLYCGSLYWADFLCADGLLVDVANCHLIDGLSFATFSCKTGGSGSITHTNFSTPGYDFQHLFADVLLLRTPGSGCSGPAACDWSLTPWGICNFRQVLQPRVCGSGWTVHPFQGFTHLLTVVNQTVSWPEAVPLSSVTSADVIHAFRGVTGFGSPCEVTPNRTPVGFGASVSTDQIPGCTGSSQYRLQSTGCFCECFHRPLKTAMCADSIQPLRRTWMLHLPGWFLGNHTMFWRNFCQRGLPEEGTITFSFPVVHQFLSKPVCPRPAPVQQLCQAPQDLFVLPPEAPLCHWHVLPW